jgi:hypothetical protein
MGENQIAHAKVRDQPVAGGKLFAQLSFGGPRHFYSPGGWLMWLTLIQSPVKKQVDFLLRLTSYRKIITTAPGVSAPCRPMPFRIFLNR